MKNQDKEIDILTLIARIVNFIKKYFLVLVIFTILGVIGGFIHFYCSKEVYKTKLIASSPIVDNRIVYELLEPLKIHIKNNQNDSVANKLNINSDVATSIHALSFDTTVNRTLIVNLEVFSKENIKVICNGIIDFLNDIEYINRQVNYKKKELTDYIAIIDNEISKLNNLQDAMLKNAQLASNLSISNTYSEMLTLVERKRELEKELSGLTSFQIINANIVFDTSKSSVIKSLLVFTFLGAFLGFCIAIFIDLKRKVNAINKK